jgi:pimeloyl-ACP methyl ester carboxylesterase
MAEQVDAYAALLDSLDIDQVAVLGGSGGAPAAIAFAERHPHRVWAVGHLFGLAGGLPEGDDDPPPPPPPFLRVINVLFGSDFMRWCMLKATAIAPGKTLLSEDFGFFNNDSRSRVLADPAKIESFLDMLWTAFTYQRETGLINDISQFAALDQSGAAAIRAPVLFIHGTDDNNAPYDEAFELSKRIEGAEFIAVEGGDHWIAISRPEDFNPQLIAFLTRHAPDKRESR